MLLLVFLCTVILLLVLVEGFFSGSETALTSASKAFLYSEAETGDARAIIAQRLLDRPERFLGTTLMGTNLAVVLSTTLAQHVVSPYVSPRWESLANTLLMTPLVLILGELIPKSIGRAHADTMALSLARPLWIAWRLFSPLVYVTSGIAAFLAGTIGAKREPGETPYVTRDDLRAAAELAGEQGMVPASAGSMLRTVFELDRKPVSAVMVPLVDVSSVPLDATVGDVEKLAVQTGFTRFPVFQNRVDEIVGIVDLRQLLYRLADQTDETAHLTAEAPITELVRGNIAFVPESKPVGTLLHELRYHKSPMAVVVDEHGGVVGILTTEDLVEEVVGEIHDERDRSVCELKEITDSIFECDGKLEIRELEERLGIEVERAGFETVAGLVLKLAGRIPLVGERFHFRDYEIEVLRVARRRVARLRLRRLPEHS